MYELEYHGLIIHLTMNLLNKFHFYAYQQKKLSIALAEILVTVVGKSTVLHKLYEPKRESYFCLLVQPSSK
jgi:hypothetical protein